MDLRQIRQFLAAVKHGNLTLAAAELNVSQPALSKSIKLLEQSLGVKLLERGRFGVSPTAFGVALAGHGKVINAEIRHAESEIEALRGARRGHVLMGCGPTEATRLLPLAATRLLKSNPALELSVIDGLNETLMPLVRQGEIDFALSSVPVTSSDPDLIHDSLFTETACVVARAGHPLTRRRASGPMLRPNELAGFPWILARRHELERRALDEVFTVAGLAPPEAAIETTSTVLMKAAVLLSDFLTFLPRELMYWEERVGQLVVLNVSAPSWTRSVGITRRRRGALSPASRALVEALTAASAELAARPVVRRRGADA
ncbi:MAG: LysR family transcriptional regulator [Betaproteobacteria bacterium]|nr:LysR family transcriptional regulator [Betaproteobacteria bacterium]